MAELAAAICIEQGIIESGGIKVLIAIYLLADMVSILYKLAVECIAQFFGFDDQLGSGKGYTSD